MSIQQIMDSIYVLPILLEHLEKPTDDTRAVLKHVGIGEEELLHAEKLKDLLKYHEHFIRWLGPEYEQLRTGLEQYWRLYLSDMFKILRLTNKKGTFIDYGCGAGQAGLQFERDNPEANVVLIDKVKSFPRITPIDFEQDPNWHNAYKEVARWVFMSELLHCKSPIVQKYLIHSAWELLKPNGSLIIVENDDPIMVYRINKLKGTTYKVLNASDIDALCRTHFNHQFNLRIKNHTIYVYERVQ